MAKEEYVFHMSLEERNILLNIIMEYHNNLIREGKTNEDVIALLKKICKTPARRDPRWSRCEER